MSLKIAQLGQPVLRHIAAPVPPEEIATPEFQAFLAAMRATLAQERGIGLAAPQVFDGRRVFLAGVWPPTSPDEPPGLEVFINPQLVRQSEEQAQSWEGCLSFPELLVRVSRSVEVEVEYLNEEGQQRALVLRDLPARVVQHEQDHLDGILTLDRALSSRHIIKASEIDSAENN